MNKIKTSKFNQRTVKILNSDSGLMSDAIFNVKAYSDKEVYIGTDNGLNFLKHDGTYGTFECGPVKYIHKFRDKVYFSSGKSLFCFNKNSINKVTDLEEDINGISGNVELYISTKDYLYKEQNGISRYLEMDMPAETLEVNNDSIRVSSGRCLMVFAGKRKHWMCIFPEHTNMPEFTINSMRIDENTGFLWLGTDKGLCIYDGRSNWFTCKDIDALPENEIFSIDFAENGDVILGSDTGIVILSNGRSKYLPATRWAADNKINCVSVCKNKIYAGTDKGLSVIENVSMSLKEKADYYYEMAEKHYVRKDGFVSGYYHVKDGDFLTGVPSCTDNDGLWTQCYIMALSYCYAVTKDKKVLESARRSMNAMLLLTRVSGIKGFTARAVRYPDEPGFGIDLDMQIDGAEWHKSPDKIREWLGETSSDEMTGHFCGFSCYYDLCANEKEKSSIRKAVCDITDHIIDNGYRLIDYDGKPTTWACWSPSELNGNNMWQWEKCLNSLEILTFLSVAYHVSGKQKYLDEYMRLGIEEHYFLNSAQHKKDDARITHIDDNLGFLCTSTILKYEKDPRIRSYILMGLRHHWLYERNEGFPFWNFIYGANTDDVCDIDTAVNYLKLMPLDLVNRIMINSNRKGLVYDTEQEKWGGGKQLIKPLEIDERSYTSYSDNPYFADSGNGRRAIYINNYLLPYWYARYYKLID